LNIFLSLF